MWLRNSNFDNDLIGSQEPSLGYRDYTTEQSLFKTVNYYHVLNPDSNAFVCYDLSQTIQHIIQTYIKNQRTFKPALQNLNNLNLIRTTSTPISSFKFRHMRDENIPISKETFFKQYGVKYEKVKYQTSNHHGVFH